MAPPICRVLLELGFAGELMAEGRHTAVAVARQSEAFSLDVLESSH